jgi:hypothetical protein
MPRGKGSRGGESRKEQGVRLRGEDWAKREASQRAEAKYLTLEGLLGEMGIGIEKDFLLLMEFLRTVKGRFAALDDLREAIETTSKPGNWASGDFLLARNEFRSPDLDEIIDWKQLNKVEIASCLAAAGMTLGIDRARQILGANFHSVMQAAIDSATDPEGGGIAQADRKLLFDATGIMPRGPNTLVQVNNNTQVVVGLPKWEEADRVVGETYFQKALGPVQSKDHVVEAEIMEEKDGVPINANT